jgi:hypothetical protein
MPSWRFHTLQRFGAPRFKFNLIWCTPEPTNSVDKVADEMKPGLTRGSHGCVWKRRNKTAGVCSNPPSSALILRSKAAQITKTLDYRYV